MGKTSVLGVVCVGHLGNEEVEDAEDKELESGWWLLMIGYPDTERTSRFIRIGEAVS